MGKNKTIMIITKEQQEALISNYLNEKLKDFTKKKK